MAIHKSYQRIMFMNDDYVRRHARTFTSHNKNRCSLYTFAFSAKIDNLKRNSNVESEVDIYAFYLLTIFILVKHLKLISFTLVWLPKEMRKLLMIMKRRWMR